jgi:hypothetical protein
VLEWESQRHRLAFWISYEDWQTLKAQKSGLLRPFRSDTLRWLRAKAPLSAMSLWKKE